MSTLKKLKSMDVSKIAAAIEADAGHALPGLRESLSESKGCDHLTIHTPKVIVARRRGRPAGSVSLAVKEPVKIRLDADVLKELRNSGDGWQTRVNEMLRASLTLAGRLPSKA